MAIIIIIINFYLEKQLNFIKLVQLGLDTAHVLTMFVLIIIKNIMAIHKYWSE